MLQCLSQRRANAQARVTVDRPSSRPLPRIQCAQHHKHSAPDVAIRLFEELAREHCPTVRVSLAHFPTYGLGWCPSPSPTPPFPSPCTRPSNPPPPHNLSCPATSPPTPTDANPMYPSPPSHPPNPSHPSSSSPDPGPGVPPPAPPITLLSVPLHLCLSHEVPGCCPPLLRSPALTALFASGAPWEVSLAATLLWACRMPHSRGSGKTSSGSGGSMSVDGSASSSPGLYDNVSSSTSGSMSVDSSSRSISTGGGSSPWGSADSGRSSGSGSEDYSYGSLNSLEMYDSVSDAEGAAQSAASSDCVSDSGSGSCVAMDGSAPLVTAETLAGVAGHAGATVSPDDCFARFWRRYRSLLPPPGWLPPSLLACSGWELRQLQDPALAAEARSWQLTVVQWYDRWIAAPAFRGEAGEVSLREWLWAVGAVESRAFGFRSPDDGRELHAYVPFFCLANHHPAAPTWHRLAPAGGSSQQPPSYADMLSLQRPPGGEPEQKPACEEQQQKEQEEQQQQQPSSAPQQQPPWAQPRRTQQQQLQSLPQRPPRTQPDSPQQLFIDYGKKDNRALVLQYGFVLYGNPYDRLDWVGAVLSADGVPYRMRRDWVYDTAAQLAGEVEGACNLHVAGDGIGDGKSVIKMDQEAKDGNEGIEWRKLLAWGGTAAARRRFRSAAASIVAACGWRNLREKKAVSPASELQAVLSLSGWVEGRLRGRSAPASAQQDVALLMQLMQGGEAGAMAEAEAAEASEGLWEEGEGEGQEGTDKVAGQEGGEVDGQGGEGGVEGRFQEAVGRSRARWQLAVEYRLERKLLLVSSLVLLRRLRAGL